MASNEPVPAVPNGPANTEPTSPRANRGRGGGFRGGNRGGNHFNGNQDNGRGRGYRGRGRGRGRGGNNNQQRSMDGATEPLLPSIPPGPSLTNRGTFGGRLTEDAKPTTGDKVLQENGGEATEEVEAEVCFICASLVVHNSVAPCNHRTCHICALRLRALYKTKACAHCRTLADYVIFTDDPNKRYEDFTDGDFSQQDPNLGVKYEKQEIFEDTLLLLRYNCPDESCDVACLGWPDLHRHVKSVHHKIMCDLCTRNKKVFTHEHELFAHNELRQHERFGDDHPGAEDQTGFKGHPECGFCRQRFYGDDELYSHCRERHERCFICDRRSQGRPQYYLDYNMLEEHFRKGHFLCPDTECLEKKFVVFDSEIDLKAHQIQEHPNGMTKDRNARRIDMLGFNLREQYEPQRGGRRGGRGGREGREGREEREGRGRGRGRDPNVDPLPQSSAQPQSRAELAYQRQMAIQSAQSVSNRTFGGQLTQEPAYAARPAAPGQEPQTVTVQRPTNPPEMPPLESLNISQNGPGGAPQSALPREMTPQERARQLRHNAVTERASNMLRNDAQKLAEFRTKISAYRSEKTTAPELIDAFFTLFDTTSSNLGKLIKELAEIFEIQQKRDGLLKAWADWRAVNEDYPSLPGPSGVPAGTAAAVLGSGGSRVLKLKSSTARSQQSAVSRHASWGTVPGATPANANARSSAHTPFPPLAAAAGSSSANRAGQGRVGPVPWVASSSASSARPSPGASAVPSRAGTPSGGRAQAAAPPRKTADLFPALPIAAKPSSTVFSPGYTGAAIRRVDGGAGRGGVAAGVGSAWGSQTNSGSATPADVLEEEVDVGAGRRKQQGKGKKWMPLG